MPKLLKIVSAFALMAATFVALRGDAPLSALVPAGLLLWCLSELV
jgi:hypothetical protein